MTSVASKWQRFFDSRRLEIVENRRLSIEVTKFPNIMFTIKKKWENFPSAHVQHLHPGHCSLIHGHNWSFEIKFGCDKLDAHGFVIDFGDLGWVKDWLTTMFDHTLLLNVDDPHAVEIAKDPNWLKLPAHVRFVPNCGAEGLAQFAWQELSRFLKGQKELASRGVRIVSVTVFEDSKNSATFCARASLHQTLPDEG